MYVINFLHSLQFNNHFIFAYKIWYEFRFQQYIPIHYL